MTIIACVVTIPVQAFELAYLRILPGPDVPLYAGQNELGVPPGGDGPGDRLRATVPAGTVLRADADRMGGSMVFVWSGDGFNGWGASERFERIYPQELLPGVPVAGACWGGEPSWSLVWNGADVSLDFGEALSGIGQISEFAASPDLPSTAAFFSVTVADASIIVVMDPATLGATGMIANEIAALGGVIIAGETPRAFSGGCVARDEAFAP